MYIMSDSMYATMSISTGLYPNLDLLNVNKLQLQCYVILYLLHKNICVRWMFSLYICTVLEDFQW